MSLVKVLRSLLLKCPECHSAFCKSCSCLDNDNGKIYCINAFKCRPHLIGDALVKRAARVTYLPESQGPYRQSQMGYVLEKLLAHITSKITNFVCFTILDLGEDADKHLHVIWSWAEMTPKRAEEGGGDGVEWEPDQWENIVMEWSP